MRKNCKTVWEQQPRTLSHCRDNQWQVIVCSNLKQKIFMLVACAILAGGCATDKDSAGAANAQQKQSDKTPEVGMTKDQVIAM